MSDVPGLKALKDKMFPHVLVFFQWVLLVLLVGLDLNFSVFVSRAVTQGGFKVITFYHVFVPFSSMLLLLAFYSVRREGVVEKCILGLSVVASTCGFLSICLNFVNDFVYLMKSTELVAWSIYNVMFALSAYKFLAMLLEYLKRGLVGSKANSNENIQVQGQEWMAKKGHR